MCKNLATTLHFALALLYFIPVTSQARSQDLYFDPQPRDLDAVEGDEVTMRCDVSNRAFIAFHWTLNGRRLGNDTRRFQQDSVLRIVSADGAQDSGTYICFATNVSSGLKLRSRAAVLNVLCEYQPLFLPLLFPTSPSLIPRPDAFDSPVLQFDTK